MYILNNNILALIIFNIDKITTTDSGISSLPLNHNDWKNWVSASRTRNYSIEDTLSDWLDLYGAEFGFTPDKSLPNYDPRYDWTEFIFEKGNLFEDRFINYINHSKCLRKNS